MHGHRSAFAQLRSVLRIETGKRDNPALSDARAPRIQITFDAAECEFLSGAQAVARRYHLSKRAQITGVTGQDGAYLAEPRIKQRYEVHGIKRRASLFNTDRIDHLYQDRHEKSLRMHLHYGDLTDATNLIRIVQPDEIYNLAAQSHVAVSLEMPEYTANSDALGRSSGINAGLGQLQDAHLSALMNLGLVGEFVWLPFHASVLVHKVRATHARRRSAILGALVVHAVHRLSGGATFSSDLHPVWIRRAMFFFLVAMEPGATSTQIVLMDAHHEA